MSQHISQLGIVLKFHPLREADLFLTILLQQAGKITALARGARRSKRRFMGGVDLFDCGEFTVSTPRSATAYLQLDSFRNGEHLLGLRTDLHRLSLASLCVEVATMFAAEGDPEGGLFFEPLRTSLRAIDSLASDLTLAHTVHFILDALHIAGLDPRHSREQVSQGTLDLWESVAIGRSADRPRLEHALSHLLNFTEEVIGCGLRSRPFIGMRGQTPSCPDLLRVTIPVRQVTTGM